MKKKRTRFVDILFCLIIPLTVLAILSIIFIGVVTAPARREAEQSMAPARQANTIWKTEQNDLYLISGPKPLQPGNFHVYALWENEYREATLDFGNPSKQAVLAITDTKEISDSPDSICLADGTYCIKKDLVVIDSFQDRSSKAFLQGRDSLKIKKYSYDELINELPFSFDAK